MVWYMERRSRQKSGKYITVENFLFFIFILIILLFIFILFYFIIVRRISKLRMEYKGYTVVMIACYAV